MKSALLEKKDGIATITLNRPKAMNSMDQSLLDDTYAAVLDAEKDPAVRVVVLTGEGKAFCAGGDLTYIKGEITTATRAREFVALAGEISMRLHMMSKPVIAMVNGVAAGAGSNWALACDIIYVAESARFGQSFALVGLIPDAGGHFFLPRAVGLHKAKELMFTGKLISARDAKDLGMVNEVFPDDQLKEKTFELAKSLAAGPPLALARIKDTLNLSLHNGLKTVLDAESNAQAVAMMSEDGREGMTAFAERRPPNFKGK